MLYFYRLERVCNYFYLYSKADEPLVKDFIYNLFANFYREAKEKGIEEYLIMKGFKILFYDSLRYLFFLDYKLIETGDYLKNIVEKRLRKEVLNYLFNFSFINELFLDKKIIDWVNLKKEEKKGHVKSFIKELEDVYLKFKYSKDLLSETIRLVKSGVFYSYLEKNKELLFFKAEIYKIKTQKLYPLKKDDLFAFKLFLAFPFFSLFDFPEKVLFDSILIHLDEKLELESDSTFFNNFIENFSYIILSNLKEDMVLKKKAKEKEIEILKLI